MILKATGYILLIPIALTLLAIWNWKPGIFVLAFLIVLGGANLIYRMWAGQVLNNKAYMLAVIVAVAAVLFLVWMNVAVEGILGDNPANKMYFGVLLVGITGALLSHLKAQGMARTLFAAAFAIMLVPAIALSIGTPAFANGVAAVFGLHAVFAILFAGSGILFRRAAHKG